MNHMFGVAITQLESQHDRMLERIQEVTRNPPKDSSAESLLAILRTGVEVGRIINSGDNKPQTSAYRRIINALWDSVNSTSITDYGGVALLTVLSFIETSSGDRLDAGSVARKNRRELAMAARSRIMGESTLRSGRFPEINLLASLISRVSGYNSVIDSARFRNVWDYVEELQVFDFTHNNLFINAAEYERYDLLASALRRGLESRSSLDDVRDYAVSVTEELCQVGDSKTNPFTQSVAGDSVMHQKSAGVVFQSPDSVRDNSLELMGRSEPSKANEYTVWYATDREPNQRGMDHGFLNKRDPLERLHVGTCVVRIPQSHRLGSLGRQWLSRWPTIDGGALTLQNVSPYSDLDEFVKSLGNALGEVPVDERVVVIYVHGYNSTFKRSAIRAAQIGFDLGVPGAMAFFSWPSRGRPIAYSADEATVDTSEKRFTQFVEAIATRTGASQVNLIAHSMGNRLTARAMSAVRYAGVKLGKVILAAPDIDTQLFKNLAWAYPLVSEKTTMYVSHKDTAVKLSRFLHGYHRAGFMPPVTIVPDIDTVAVGHVDLSQIGHGYFAAAGPVLDDIKAVFDGNIHPHLRPRLSSVSSSSSSGAHWVLRK